MTLSQSSLCGVAQFTRKKELVERSYLLSTLVTHLSPASTYHPPRRGIIWDHTAPFTSILPRTLSGSPSPVSAPISGMAGGAGSSEFG